MLPSNETKSINLTLEEIAWWAMSANGGMGKISLP